MLWELFHKHSPSTIILSFPHLEAFESTIWPLTHKPWEFLPKLSIFFRISNLEIFSHMLGKPNKMNSALTIQGLQLANKLVLPNVKGNQVISINEIQIFSIDWFLPVDASAFVAYLEPFLLIVRL